jgi:hypothetical protein
VRLATLEAIHCFSRRDVRHSSVTAFCNDLGLYQRDGPNFPCGTRALHQAHLAVASTGYWPLRMLLSTAIVTRAIETALIRRVGLTCKAVPAAVSSRACAVTGYLR